MTYDNTHNITAASGTVGAATLTYADGQFLFDGAALTVQWEDWDGTIWTMTQIQGS